VQGKGSVFKDYQAKTQEGFADNYVKKSEALTFRLQADWIHGFGLGMWRFFSAKREGGAEWKTKNGDWVQDFFKQSAFAKMQPAEWRKWAERFTNRIVFLK
jgi:hypothetical protein